MIVATGRFTLVRAQSPNASSPMLIANGRLTLVRAEQRINASIPTVVTADASKDVKY
ncbi:hypothetical protein FACS1894204_04230 [Synergistales bacterium]|nr:hypothetical protein FACS1894204_04230 [Synergistales bacterium]